MIMDNLTTNDGAAVLLRNIRRGEYVKRTPTAKTVYVRGGYDLATKSYSLTDCDDMNREIFVKANKVVFVGFTY